MGPAVRKRGFGEAWTNTPSSIESESSPEQVYQLVTGLIEEDLLLLLAQGLWRLPFESRKDSQVIFSYVFRFRPPTASPKTDPIALSHVLNSKPQVLLDLCRAYEHKESATPAGTVLRELIKTEAAAAVILYDDGEAPGSSSKGVTAIDRDRPQSGNGVFWKFFDWIDKSSFEVAADAFTTFRVGCPDPLLPKATRGADCVGTPHQTQGTGSQIPRHQLRTLLRQVQPRTRPVELVCHQAPVDQAAWRNPARPVQL